MLTDRSIIGHSIFLDDHPFTPWHTGRDLALLAEAGAAVAHCPTVFARRGIALRDMGRLRRAGVRVGIGTDTFPHNMLEEMWLAMYLARTQAGNPRTLTGGELFTAATAGGAAMLGRDDIGRLAPGCRADLVLVDLAHPAMRPGYDLLCSLLYAAADRAVRAVYVDGAKVVEEGRVLTMDYPAAAAALDEAQARMVRDVPSRDWAQRGRGGGQPADVPPWLTPAMPGPGRGTGPSLRGKGGLQPPMWPARMAVRPGWPGGGSGEAGFQGCSSSLSCWRAPARPWLRP